ncbi:hypothetical protein [Stenotrophomonas oahuensis]|uniref:Uncharacterized protein n=1 Tax=Stenotrophomonas oahuensis TaxID=3003271 RepID=A0ABY9YJ07_9GAMM|nr:hypothetical protein [Stenotrophomonas sp. A5586]WNH50867.1 hypothetical protein PDM29_10720 [Stenotrophomonas sp. A5586]
MRAAPATAPTPSPLALRNLVNLPVENIATAAPESPRALMVRIKTDDLTLCQMMAHGRDAQTPARTADAQTLIDGLSGRRVLLARTTAEDLRRWSDSVDAPPFGQHLQDRIECAGLDQILIELQRTLLLPAQRLRIGESLRDAGARTASVRDGLCLTHPELELVRAEALLDRLIPAERAAALQLDAFRPNPMTASREVTDPQRRALRTERALAYQRAAMINRRFGYTVAHPAWNYMHLTRENKVRAGQLELLSKTPEAKRRGITLLLP